MKRWTLLLLLAVALPLPAQTVLPEENPFFVEWSTPFGLPPFGDIRPEHFLPAIERGMALQKQEVAAIVANSEPPTFANTIEALDASGELLAKVLGVFQNLVSAETNEALQEIACTTAPRLAAHRDDINLDPRLLARVRAVWEARDRLHLTPEQAKLLEETWKGFVRGGALLDQQAQARLRAINAELATAGTKFGDNLLKEINSYRLVISDPADLAGLPERVKAGAAEAARRAGLEGKWVFTLHAPSIWPFLEAADNRELRRQIFSAYTSRGDHGNETDNKVLAARMAALRAERARLLDFATWADFVLDEAMAKTPERVWDLLNRLWVPAKAVAAREAADLEAAIAADGKSFELEPWDWFYYTEKLRKARYDLDESALRPYFELERVRNGAFYVANRLYGITFTELSNVPVYHPEVKAFEVKDADGSHLAVLLCDYHPRPGKRTGAWTSRYRGQYWKDGREIRPIVVNVGNFSRPTGGTPALLSRDEVETLFHEFGHALHSIFSRIHYRSLAGTPRDFVELPSQIMEHWAFEPEVLKVYARHWATGEVIPDELVRKIQATSRFNQGFATTEYLAAALLDMEWHTLTAAAEPDTAAFERIALARMGMPRTIVPRYRSTYFQHIFGPGGGYSAGYYAYIWSAVLDNDAYEAFRERGLFDRATAESFRRNILEKAGSDDAMAMWLRFRGREPSVAPLLAQRGLAAPCP